MLQIIIALSAFSNRSILKCEATLSGRDTQSEMETETSCEAQALTLECSQHRPRIDQFSSVKQPFRDEILSQKWRQKHRVKRKH